MNKFKLGTTLCCCTALLGILGGVAIKTDGFQDWNFTSKQIEANDVIDDLEAIEVVENMNVALLSKVTNQDGSTSYTYSYEIGPNDTTRLHVTGAMSFVDNTQGVNDYLGFSIDETNKTFTIIKKADFAHQAKFVLTCDAKPSVNATIYLDCKQYFTGYNDFSEKTYRKLITDQEGVSIDEIQADMEEEAGVDNLSTDYTIALDNPYRLEHIHYVATAYLTGNNIESMSSGTSVNKNYAIYQTDLASDLSLSTLVEKVYADQEYKFTNQQARVFQNNSLFGVSYDLFFTFNVDGAIKIATAHMIVVADSSSFSFGLPGSITLESNAKTFEDYSATYALLTNEYNTEHDYEFAVDENTGWLYYQKQYQASYINIVVTRYLDGVQVEESKLFSANDNKGVYAGTDSETRYLVYNPGNGDDVTWSNVYKKFNDNLYLVNNLTVSE